MVPVSGAAWESVASEWADHVRGGGDKNFDRNASTLTSLLPAPSGLTLDLGCGEGRLS
jgi:hypothetical protein